MATILKTDGTKETIEDLSLNSLQKAVGGYIQLIQFPDGSEMVLNEEGKLIGLLPNIVATKLFQEKI